MEEQDDKKVEDKKGATGVESTPILPSKKDLDAARAAAAKFGKTSKLKPGTVIGLDHDKYATAILDLTLPDSNIVAQRVIYASKGYVKLGGSYTVIGFPSAEVWVKTQEDRAQALVDRRKFLVDAVRSRQMHKSAIADMRVNRPTDMAE